MRGRRRRDRSGSQLDARGWEPEPAQVLDRVDVLAGETG